jgi:hypothetical protein
MSPRRREKHESGAMFRRWCSVCMFATTKEVAHALGVNLETARTYWRGDKFPDRRTRLAMTAIAAGLTAWEDE